jgi:hypothetical protein
MVEFPTKPQLAEIYIQQGSNATTWYAWRNALRVVPVLGRIPLRTMWPKFTVQYTYYTLRVCFLLSQGADFINREIADKAKLAAANAANFEGFATHDIGYAIAYAAYAAMYNAADKATVASSFAADTASYTNATLQVSCPNAQSGIIKAAQADYKFLRKQPNFTWELRPLWPKQFFIATKPDYYEQWEENLLHDLKGVGLEFMSNDLKNLLEDKPLGQHLKNYAKVLPNELSKDPAALRRAILLNESTDLMALGV